MLNIIQISNNQVNLEFENEVIEIYKIPTGISLYTSIGKHMYQNPMMLKRAIESASMDIKYDNFILIANDFDNILYKVKEMLHI